MGQQTQAQGQPGQSAPPPGSPQGKSSSNQNQMMNGTSYQQSQSNGKGSSPIGTPVGVAPQGKGGSQQGQLMQPSQPGQAVNTVSSGQPIMGQPNNYMNTVGNSTQPVFNNQAYQPQQHGKGKG